MRGFDSWMRELRQVAGERNMGELIGDEHEHADGFMAGATPLQELQHRLENAARGASPLDEIAELA